MKVLSFLLVVFGVMILAGCSNSHGYLDPHNAGSMEPRWDPTAKYNRLLPPDIVRPEDCTCFL